MTNVDRASLGTADPLGASLTAAAAPLVVAGLAFALWLISDRLGGIGPLDRATFGWSVVVPIWILAPLTAAWGWRGQSGRREVIAATLTGMAVGLATAGLFWQGVAFPACEFGAIRQPVDFLLPALSLGFIVGGGFGLSGIVASGQVRSGLPRRAMLGGLGVQAGASLIAITFAALTLTGPGCQRPPI
jgi:hypothetical protein